MNFIEWFLGIAPDGGDGSIETAVMLILVSLGTLLLRRQRRIVAVSRRA